jgi:hypothetical protein
MKKLILIFSLVIASAIFTNANASSKAFDAKHNSSVQKVGTTSYLKNAFSEPQTTGYIFSSNGSLWLLVVYDNGNTELTWLMYLP